MVCLIWTCNCDTCVGGHSVIGVPGEMVFGGSKCMCACHTKSGKEREEYIKLKKEWESRQ